MQTFIAMRNIYILFSLLVLSVYAEKARASSDELFWNGVRYFIWNTPLATVRNHHDYIVLFSNLPRRKIRESFETPNYPPFFDKNYTVIWKLADSTLYIGDLHFFTLRNPKKDLPLFFITDENEPYRRMERFTGGRFIRDTEISSIEPVSPFGVMPATWFSGYIIVREYPDLEKIRYEKWLHAPTRKLIFRQGRLVGIEELGDTSRGV